GARRHLGPSLGRPVRAVGGHREVSFSWARCRGNAASPQDTTGRRSCGRDDGSPPMAREAIAAGATESVIDIVTTTDVGGGVLDGLCRGCRTSTYGERGARR